MREQYAAELRSRRRLMVDYARLKLAEEDWHGLQDAGSDLRDLDCELKGLEWQG